MKTRTITHTSICLPGILSGGVDMEASFLSFNFHH
jgi:hypothetical protein